MEDLMPRMNQLPDSACCEGARKRGCRKLWRAAALLVSTLAGVATAVGPKNALNDTGITTYGNATSNGLTTEPADYPGQDARIGRDAAAGAGKLPKVGGGSKGFDFTKISNSGAVLPASAALGSGSSDWGCTYDNVTGLMWEVKVNDANHLRHQDWTYTWYDTNAATNGGSAGTASGGTCRTAGRCDSKKFVEDVNATGLCGRSNWRLPTKKELISIVDFGNHAQSIDGEWHPNSPPSIFWSSTAIAYDSDRAWAFLFTDGSAYYGLKNVGHRIRLVRYGM